MRPLSTRVHQGSGNAESAQDLRGICLPAQAALKSREGAEAMSRVFFHCAPLGDQCAEQLSV